MGLEVSVPGGSNGGWRRINPPRKDWLCTDGHHNPAYRMQCRECGVRRED